MMEALERKIEISGKTYSIIRLSSSNKNASARLRGMEIIISMPSRWPHEEAEKIAAKLEAKAIKSIERGKWGTHEPKGIMFSHGQELEILGRKFRITNPENPEKIRKGIAKKVLPDIEQRVYRINMERFNADIQRVSLRDNLTRWGSYSPKGNISLNFRLLFAPAEILDYVIVHELCHSRYKSHGPRFWGAVEQIIPDHKEKRKWLKENGHKLGSEA